MAKTWRHAVVGVGVVGDWHARVIPQIPGSSLVAVADPLTDRAKASLEKHKQPNTAVFSSLEELLRATGDKIDVVHVCTPSGAHLEPVITALNAKKNVICEKPMEIQLDRIDRMIATAKQNNVRLAGVFQNRWNRANRQLKLAADEGRFGTISYAGCHTPWYRSDEYYRDGGWRGTHALDGGGAIMNQSVHAVDLLQWIAGPVKTVSAFAGSRIHAEIEVEDTLACSLQFASGAYGVIMGSTGMWPGVSVRVEVGGANGTAISEDGLKTYKFRDERPEDQQIVDRLTPNGPQSTGGGSSPTDVPADLHLQNIDAILRAWESNRDAETNAAESRKAVAIILAMYESAKKGGVPIAVA
ncbi:MAG: Gfo/Idh/MocA family oxidoreductase [Anaerolineae bacterium]|nr:Gfo/Idh/MocA family oxidoreductase [Phycisphaerae bacterium]